MEKKDNNWVYIGPLVIFIVCLLTIFEPKGYNYIALAISSGLLAFVGYMRSKNFVDKIAIFLGVILFIVFVVLYFVK
ncbi:hypothetical protein [Solibacillus sp. FSL W7-1324]|uniref:hypothetical protein n=1 Tax=Solibacillus sp. FSL W7-1324 TaxID=2921701 RepID=UPI0030FA76D4